MATSHTSVGTAVGTAALTHWSVNTLTSHLLGLFIQSRNAAGGVVPDRFKDEVRNSLRAVWNAQDWRSQIKIGTLTVAANDSTITLPQDYRKAATAVVKDVDEGCWLRFTNNVARFQKVASWHDTTDDAHPMVATAIYDDSEDCGWILNITPESDDSYSFQFPYLRRCPVDLVAGHADLKGDADSILMPTPMHRLWQLHAFWQIQEHFGKEVEAAKRAQGAYDKAHKRALDEQNETVSEPVEPTARGYGDEDLFPSGGGYSGEANRLPYEVFP